MENAYIIVIFFLILIIVLTIGIILFIYYNKNNDVTNKQYEESRDIKNDWCKDNNDYFNYENTDDDIILF